MSRSNIDAGYSFRVDNPMKFRQYLTFELFKIFLCESVLFDELFKILSNYFLNLLLLLSFLTQGSKRIHAVFVHKLFGKHVLKIHFMSLVILLLNTLLILFWIKVVSKLQ